MSITPYIFFPVGPGHKVLTFLCMLVLLHQLKVFERKDHVLQVSVSPQVSYTQYYL